MIALWGVEVHSAQDVVTFSAACAGVLWVYVNLLRPLARGLKHGVLLLIATVKAVGVLDDLPAWMGKREEVEASIEAEVAVVHSRLSKIENVQTALVRDLKIDVRQPVQQDGLSESV